MAEESQPIELCLCVYLSRSELHHKNGAVEVYLEGRPSADSRARYSKIQLALEEGFLEHMIAECSFPTTEIEDMPAEHQVLLQRLVDSLTSEVGRALVAITIMQLCIKCILPEQNIRLHKGGRGNFSWEEGISMRSLDKCHITPVLRRFDLLRLNADGFMMTRSLAENYPYTKLYKAAMRGARNEWLTIVDLLERNEISPEPALKYLLARLHNRSATFIKNSDGALESVNNIVDGEPSSDEVTEFIEDLVESSSYSARVFEISMHALFQVLEEHGAFAGELERISQMRSANKKHGNIGDIEIVERRGSKQIIESWDAKYGKPYLRDELEELHEKLADHPETQLAGFVTSVEPDLREDIIRRKGEIEAFYDIEIQICYFGAWIEQQLARVDEDSDKLARDWLVAFTESICQRRREIAPIDEPSDLWVAEVKEKASRKLNAES